MLKDDNRFTPRCDCVDMFWCVASAFAMITLSVRFQLMCGHTKTSVLIMGLVLFQRRSDQRRIGQSHFWSLFAFSGVVLKVGIS